MGRLLRNHMKNLNEIICFYISNVHEKVSERSFVQKGSSAVLL